MLITLTNNFHGTSTSLRVPASGRLSARQVSRARRALCGVAGCTCPGPLGTRGRQTVWVLEHGDGTATVAAREAES